MNRVSVIFEGTPYKKYYYNTKLDLLEGGFYKIVADNTTAYDNFAYVWAIERGSRDSQ